MNASQQGLNVAGQNIANINTKGYTRQRVDIVSLNLQNGDQYSSGTRIGYGVEVTGISQIRDPFLDVQYRNQIAQVGSADSRQAIMDQLADIFDETDKKAIKSSLNELASALSTLSNNVAKGENVDSAGDQSVRSQFQTLLSIIHQKSNDLSKVREGNISELEKTDIPTINNLLSDIGELSDKIWNSQIQGNAALELKDQRNSKLDELASYLPISVSYKSVNIADGASYDYPVVKFSGSDGTTFNLLSGAHGQNYASLSVERNLDSYGGEDGTVSISLTPASEYGTNVDMSSYKTDITSYISSGSLKGSLDMLNQSGLEDNPPRGLSYYENALDSFVSTLAETFNDLNKNTIPYTGVSSIPESGAATNLTSTGIEKATYNIDFQNASGNFLSGEKIKINNHEYTFGDGTSGTIAIGADLNATLHNLAQNMNDPDNLSINGNAAQPGKWSYAGGKLTWTSDAPLANGTVIDSNSIKTSTGNAISLSYTANSSNIANHDLFETSDGSDKFTASNIKISEKWANGTIQLKNSQQEDAGSTANDNIIRMIDALKKDQEFKYTYTYTDSSGTTQQDSISMFSGSIEEFYANLENVQGIDSSSNKAILTNHTAVLKETANNKDSISGVSLDEEGIDLMKFQKSFTAAARLMTTLDEALDVLINKTGVVGR
jgi:flagellar hook-associated protein 1 FlgK